MNCPAGNSSAHFKHYIAKKHKDLKMAYCPHCKKELNQDNLENTMNEFEAGDNAQNILSYCEHCQNSIRIIHRKFLYYIESIQENEENQCIGAK